MIVDGNPYTSLTTTHRILVKSYLICHANIAIITTVNIRRDTWHALYQNHATLEKFLKEHIIEYNNYQGHNGWIYPYDEWFH